MAQVNLNTSELKSFVNHIVTNNRYLQQNGKIPVAVAVEGEAGIGKTSTILEIGKSLGLHVVKLNLAQIEEIGDLTGFPMKEFEIKKDEVTKWVPENTLPLYIQNKYIPTGEKRMTHAAPEWAQGRTQPVLLLLDDYSRASEKFIQATMTLIETQCYNSWCLPKGSFIILTSNPDNGNYSVSALDAAQKTRTINVNYKFDINAWARYAEKTGIDGRCVNFLLLHPELMENDSINARTVTMFFNSLMSISNFSDELPLIQQLGEATTNPEFSTLFTTFINNKLDKLVTPKDMLLHQNESYIIGELNSCIGTDSDYRADIASVLATRLINFTVNYAESNTITPAIIDRLTKFCTGEVFTNDLKYIIVRKIINSNKQKFQKLMLNSEIVKMAMK